jgi:hypothetical protein
VIPELDNYFLLKPEPFKSCLLALREIILKLDPNVDEAWKYSMPFYRFKGKRFCYLWVHKKYNKPYLGIVDGKLIDHPELIIEGRARMKIMLLDPNKDLPVKTIRSILKLAVALHQNK